MSTKTKTQQYYSFLNENSYFEALSVLDNFSFESFENIFFNSIRFHPKGTENPCPKLQKGAFINFFFSQYLHLSPYFIDICKSSRRREWFEQLFMRDELICPNLYKRMAEEAPDSLVEAMKRNLVPFQKAKHFTEIVKNDRNAELNEFFFLGAKLAQRELIYFADAHMKGSKIAGKSNEEIFSIVGNWLFYYVWDLSVNKNNSDLDRQKETIAIFAMNDFLTWFLRQDNGKALASTDTDKFQADMIAAEEPRPPFYDVFEAWLKWRNFVLNFIDEFCFDDDVQVYFDSNETIKIKGLNTVYEKYVYNSKKLLTYENFESEDFNDFKFKREFTDKEKFVLKFIGPSFNRSYRNLVDEFISAIHFDNYKLRIEATIGAAYSFVSIDKLWFNRETEMGFSKKLNWKEILHKVSKPKMHTSFNQRPFSKEQIEVSQRFNTNYFKNVELELEELKQCCNSFTFDVSKIKWNKHYSRFNSEINLFDALRFKIGNNFYSFPRINASVQMHTFITILSLRTHTNRDAQKLINSEMEKLISELALKKDLKAISQFEYSFINDFNEPINGEVDSVLFDGQSLMAIEFKHSTLKSTLSEISREREIVLETACGQLDKFKRYLLTGDKKINKELGIDKLIKLQKKPFIGLIVTTNFEHDHEIINEKYYKISWKEWIWILQNIKENDSIDVIMDLIIRNVYWEEIMGI